MAGPGTLREVTFPLGPSLWSPLKLSTPGSRSCVPLLCPESDFSAPKLPAFARAEQLS